MKIEIQELTKKIGNKAILDEIQLTLDPGNLVSLVGTNGAGKTTLLKTLATLYCPTTGEVRFDDAVLDRSRLDLRAKLHYLADQPHFLADLPIDHICLAATLYDRNLQELKPHIVDWLRQFDLLEIAETPIKSLSRGQQYKVAFVGMLAINPELWLLDEPFAAGVDPTGISAIKRNLNKVLGAGASVIYSTQIVELAESFSDRVWILHQGRLRVDATTLELKTQSSAFGLGGILEQLRLSK